MPIYKYECQHCSTALTKLQKISDGIPEAHCCNNPSLQRVLGESSFALAGGGWYKDGYESSKSTQSGEST